jgi:hypothetical protein
MISAASLLTLLKAKINRLKPIIIYKTSILPAFAKKAHKGRRDITPFLLNLGHGLTPMGTEKGTYSM